MMTKRAFFVLGPEGSGTHMLTNAFISVGCHEEPWHGGWPPDGNYKFGTMPDLFVFRRSLPHAKIFADLKAIREQMEVAGYKVQPLLIMRDWHCTIQSVIRRDYQRDPWVCEQNMREGPLLAFDAFPDDLIYVTYESFCMHRNFRRWLFCDRLKLPEPTLEIHYANTRYYGKGENYLK